MRQMVVGFGEKIIGLRQVSHVYPLVLPPENRRPTPREGDPHHAWRLAARMDLRPARMVRRANRPTRGNGGLPRVEGARLHAATASGRLTRVRRDVEWTVTSGIGNGVLGG